MTSPSIPPAPDPWIYGPHVRPLLRLGDSGGYDPEEWLDYPDEYDLGPADIPDLIHMACDMEWEGDEEDGDDADIEEIYAPMHAWRALGQMGAEAAAAPLLDRVSPYADEDDDIGIDLPVVFSMIGPAALPLLQEALAARSRPQPSLRVAIAGLGEIALRHPDHRAACVGSLTAFLADRERVDPELNATAILVLVDLVAVEAIETITEAFERKAVDIDISRDLEDVEIKLGLRTERTTPARLSIWDAISFDDEPDDQDPWPEAPPRPALAPAPPQAQVRVPKVGRNEPCPCGSGRKYKKCCLNRPA